jgi:hypothetical protein
MFRALFSRLRKALGRFLDVAYGDTTNYKPERHYMRGPGPKWRDKHEVSSR